MAKKKVDPEWEKFLAAMMEKIRNRRKITPEQRATNKLVHNVFMKMDAEGSPITKDQIRASLRKWKSEELKKKSRGGKIPKHEPRMTQ